MRNLGTPANSYRFKHIKFPETRVPSTRGKARKNSDSHIYLPDSLLLVKERCRKQYFVCKSDRLMFQLKAHSLMHDQAYFKEIHKRLAESSA